MMAVGASGNWPGLPLVRGIAESECDDESNSKTSNAEKLNKDERRFR
jgi:hypothetical protein